MNFLRSFVHPGTVLPCLMLAAWNIAAPVHGAVNVTQHHNHDTRDGLYIDPAFTPEAAEALKRDTNFNGTIQGNVYAQPLYIEDGPAGQALILAVTESNNIYALDAGNGSVVWQRHVGAPVPLSALSCGNIDPLGITGTPVVDLASRTLFFDAMTTPDNGVTKKHLIYALNVDTGTTNSGWPVDVNASAKSGSTLFSSATQNQRGALAVLGTNLYVPYGGHYGDCGNYRGWLVGVPLNQPTNVTAWWACRSISPPTSQPGQRRPSAEARGRPAAWLVTASIRSSRQGTLSVQADGAAARPSFVSSPARCSVV